MKVLGAQFLGVFLMLGIAIIITYGLYKLFGSGGGIFGFLISIMIAFTAVRMAPLASYCLTAAITVAIKLGSSNDKRPLHLLGLVIPSLLLAALIWGGINIVGSLFSDGSVGDGKCTRVTPQFC